MTKNEISASQVEVGDFVKATFGEVFVTPDWVEVTSNSDGYLVVGNVYLVLLTITDHKPSEAHVEAQKKKVREAALELVKSSKESLEAAYAQLDGEELVELKVRINEDYSTGVIKRVTPSSVTLYWIQLDGETYQRCYARSEFKVII